MEDWREVEEFPMYMVNQYGDVYNIKSRNLLKHSINQQGIPSVAFYPEDKQYRRAVAPIVATAFLERPYPHFDTPIHLDGNRQNNNADNLMWRPRWFAIKYHQQFLSSHKQGFTVPIEIIETGEQFEDSMHAARTHGLLTNNIYDSILLNRRVFPLGMHFKLVEPLVNDRY